MDLNLLLEMVVAGLGGRRAVTAGATTLRYDDLGTGAARLASAVSDSGDDALLYLGGNHAAFPVALFGASAAGVPFVPLNYRLSAEQLAGLIARHPGALIAGQAPAGVAGKAVSSDEIIAMSSVSPTEGSTPGQTTDRSDDVALQLYTSGTSGAPKAALLRHRHLVAYVLATVEFGGASETEAALVTVPPYHIAGVANLLSNLYAGRRIVYLDVFDPEGWLSLVRSEGVTQAMVVPTMLARIVRHLDGQAADVPTLKSLAYGGSRMPQPVIEQALRCFPETGFVNAYGLTETSSTIALLGPEDHRAAVHSEEARTRLRSVGRPVPGIEVDIRDDAGASRAPGQPGGVLVRGEQISGEYDGVALLDPQGWFSTGDRGWIDREGYLYIEGRADDTIIRGGENIAPAEIEDALMRHPAVVDAAVVGVPDDEWGQRIEAAVVVGPDEEEVTADEIRAWVRTTLRSAKTPDVVTFWDQLPRTPTGKVLRREVLAAWRRPADGRPPAQDGRRRRQ
ncbi:MAG: AMP-binding protein [Actinomycetota bacterium]|nr:AMP-binding protein [Actinomycetota bacterium]